MLHCNITLYGAETWALLKVDKKYLKSFKYGAGEGWSWTDSVKSGVT